MSDTHEKRLTTLGDETDAIRAVSEIMHDFDVTEASRIFAFILERKKHRKQIDAVKSFVSKIAECQCQKCTERRRENEPATH